MKHLAEVEKRVKADEPVTFTELALAYAAELDEVNTKFDALRKLVRERLQRIRESRA